MNTSNVLVLLITFATSSVLSPQLDARDSAARAHYVGGTGTALIQKSAVHLDLDADEDLRVECKGASIRLPYSTINSLEYGQKVDRRVAEAILISPLMLLAKRRSHFLTIGFADTEGRQQAMVFQVESGDLRGLLAGLEARTGRKVEFQDDEARKAGKG